MFDRNRPEPCPIHRDMPAAVMLSLMGKSVIVFDTATCTLDFEVHNFPNETIARQTAIEASQILDGWDDVDDYRPRD
jgi:hypothetical protein